MEVLARWFDALDAPGDVIARDRTAPLTAPYLSYAQMGGPSTPSAMPWPRARPDQPTQRRPSVSAAR